MPYGDYKDFDDCVRQNRDKDDPQAYCAAIKRAIEESAPNPASPLILPLQLVADICPACAVKMRQMKMTALKITHAADFSKITSAIKARFFSSYQAMATRSVLGVEIFKIGTHTDSSGQSRQWSAADLGSLARSKLPPLKVGHTSEAFNAKLAGQLGVPLGIFTGEGGKGAARFGSVTNLRLQGDTLVADFADVPEALADLIEGGQFNAVSVEIGLVNDQPVLTAVALLGSENPAVLGLKALDLAHFSDGGSNHWISLPLADANDLIMRDFAHSEAGGSPMFNRNKAGDTKPLYNFAAEDLAQLCSSLKLEPTASAKDVVDAIGKLARPADDMAPAVTKLQAEVTKQAEYISRLEHRDRVVQYSALAQKWTAIPGKPEELGEQLAKVHETVGEEHAKTLIASYQRVQDSAQQVGILSSLGTSRAGNQFADAKDAFEDEIEKYAADNKMPFEKALAHFATNRPKDFGEYRRRVRVAVNGS